MATGRATENTDRDLLIEQLRIELSNYDILHDISFTYLDDRGLKKTFRIPDILIVKKNEYSRKKDLFSFNPESVVGIIEAERIDVHEGFSQVMGYYSLLDNNIGGIKAVFSTEYRKVIGVKFDIKRAFKEANYSKIDDLNERILRITLFIKDFLLDKLDLLSIEQSIDFFINFFESQINVLSNYTKNLSADIIEKVTGLFFAKSLDIEIERDNEFENIVKKSAAYLIINQVFFYHLLSKVRYDCEELKPIKNIDELQKLFDKVLNNINYKPIFIAKIVKILPKNTIVALNNLINTVIHLKIETLKEDIIGRIFHDLIPTSIRKRIAAYFTKIAPAKLLADLTIKKPNQIILDPTCGSGTLLLAAYQKKVELYKKSKVKDYHSKILKEIYGNDICLFSAHLSAINLSLQDPKLDIVDLVIFLEDIFKTTPETRSLSLNNIIQSEDYVLKKGRPLPPKVDVLLMNPPFTKIARMDKSYLKFVKGKLEAQVKSYFLKGQTGLQILVPLYTDDFLKTGGYVGMVIPETILSYTDTTGFQDFFKKFYKIEYIISSDAEISFSESCDWKDFLFVAKKYKSYKKNVIPKMKKTHYDNIPDIPEYFIKFILLKSELTLNNYKTISDIIKKTNKNFKNDKVKIVLISSKELNNTNQWVQFFRRDLQFRQFLNLIYEYLIVGTKIFKINRRGFYIYGKNFFFLPNKYWEIIQDDSNSITIENRDTSETLRLNKRYLNNTLRTPKEHHQDVIPKSKFYVLNITKDRIKLPVDLQRYIEWSDILDDEELSARKSDPDDFYKFTGKQITASPFGNVIIPEKYKPYNRGVSSHLVKNLVVPVSFYTRSTEDNIWDNIICAWLNSSIGLMIRYNARVILGSASERLNGDQINQLYYPDITKIDEINKENILKCFNEFIGNCPLPLLKKQLAINYRINLDKAFLKAFNYPSNLIQDFLDYIYSKLEEWINS